MQATEAHSTALIHRSTTKKPTKAGIYYAVTAEDTHFEVTTEISLHHENTESAEALSPFQPRTYHVLC
jgi:hypothetical protein